MHGLRLWEFLTGDIPCPPPLVVPVIPTIPDNAADAVRTKLLDDYDASMESYASQFAAYRTWLEEDARAGDVLLTPYFNMCQGRVLQRRKGSV